MNKLYPIGEAARMAGVTIETLRHYDRIGLVAPSLVNPGNGYRYYSETEIDKVRIIRYLRSIRLSLSTIKQLFSNDDLPTAMDTLQLACQKVDEEIENLLVVKQNLKETLDNYSSKRNTRWFIRPISAPTVRQLDEQTVFLARILHEPTIGNLSRLHSVIEDQISPDVRSRFQFENASGVLIQPENSFLFARCARFVPHPDVIILPAGRYLCLSCRSQEYRKTMDQLRHLAAADYNVRDSFVVLDIIFTGLIQWEYEVKLFLGANA